MTKALRALLKKKEEVVAQARAITTAASKDNDRDLTEEETSQYESLIAQVESINAKIERERELIMNENSLQVAESVPITGGAPRIEQDPRRGFQSFGEFAFAVANAAKHSRSLDERLVIGAAAPSTYSNEGTGTEGGFAVPPEFSMSIWNLSLEEGAFLPMTDGMPVSGNTMTFPSDETTPWGTDGVRTYWEGESEVATATKAKLNPNTMRLKKLMSLVPMTDELIEDAPGLSSYLTSKVGESIRWKTNDAIINGTGVGMPKGLFASLIQQAKETSQTADTINANNVVKMFSRALRPGRSVWLINPDAFPQLPLMTLGNQPVYVGPSGLTSAPGGTLLGRPVMMSDTCQKVGDLGDIMFVDFGMYRTLTKSGGIQSATSIHLYFDAAVTAFRTIFRLDGQPMLTSAVTPPNTTVTRSGYVALAERT